MVYSSVRVTNCKLAVLTSLFCAAAFFVVWLPPAAAQDDLTPTFGVQNFKTVPGPDSFLTVDGAKVGTHLQYSIGFMNTFQERPYIVVNCAASSPEGKCEIESERIPVIELHDSVELLGSISLFKWVQVGLVFPFTVYQKGKRIEDPATASGDGGLKSFGGVGDPRLHLKVRLLGDPAKKGLGLAFVPVISFPVGGYGPWGDSYVGEKMVTFHGKLAADYTYRMLHVGVNVGYFWREKVEVYGTSLEDQLTYGLGLMVRPHKIVGIVGEIFGSVALSRDGYYRGIFSDNRTEMPLEADGAIQLFPLKDLRLTVGGGAGILSAIGSPRFRVFLGLTYMPLPKEKEVILSDDIDLDGILNRVDSCPEEMEDYDDFEDGDGCPEVDNDKDTVLDGYDSCPQEAEDLDNFEDDDGCPDVDMDKDGIPDDKDQCPEEVEDEDGFKDDDGCPEADNDGDGLTDEEDVCPLDPEDTDGYLDRDGCFDADNDGDGIEDADDKCPDKAEIFNGVRDEDGCPDKGKALVIITEKQLEIKEQINFKTGSDEIVGKRSFQILDIVAAILKANPHISVEVQGHTDNRGTREYNIDLSQRRAESVKRYLVGKGIEEVRLVPKGFGPDRPIADNATKKGRAKNRRVEFHIVGVEAAEEPTGGGDAPETISVPSADGAGEAEPAAAPAANP